MPEEQMRFALMLEPQQGLSYDEQAEIFGRAQAAGFETVFRSDHYSSFPGATDNQTTDAWAVLAGLARDTSRIGLGVLVSPVTFRMPGNLAKLGATVQQMSGGRLEVGIGAGWNEVEHAAHGFPFPEISVRAEMLEEQLEIVRGLWEGPDGWSFEGRHYRVSNALFRAKPRPRPRIIVGGDGTPRSIRLAVRHADEFNITSSDPDRIADRYALLDETLAKAGRDPASLTRSAMIGVLVGRDDAEVERRRLALLAMTGRNDGDAEAWYEERRRRWILGTPDEARATVARFAAVGVERIMLQDFVPRDLEMIDLLGAELVSQA
ncbi:MAG TPA: TIGR03560 family F420-dependent LLM class oxidoreductase [Candidatus Limnocylindrales bacterium]|nr:TIGR03560 family F420-dependent LLM class oxidoreductase [Candidatus Limnocylindrales bacterium]